MKGFKKTGNGPRYGNFSFSSQAGFSGSTGKVQNVKGYTRKVAKHNFATGGAVKVADPGSSVVRRGQPVTQFDAQHGGKGPLRAGYAEGGKVKSIRKVLDKTPPKYQADKPHDMYTSKKTEYYMKADDAKDAKVMQDLTKKSKPKFAEGGKVATVGAAIKMVKQLMTRGESAQSAAAKAARRYGVSSGDIMAEPVGGGASKSNRRESSSKLFSTPTGGGGLPAEKQMLARGGLSKAFQRVASQAAAGRQAPTRNGLAGMAQRAAGQPLMARSQPTKIPVQNAGPVKGPSLTPHHGYGSFRRSPLLGGR